MFLCDFMKHKKKPYYKINMLYFILQKITCDTHKYNINITHITYYCLYFVVGV